VSMVGTACPYGQHFGTDWCRSFSTCAACNRAFVRVWHRRVRRVAWTVLAHVGPYAAVAVLAGLVSGFMVLAVAGWP
jgi:hypothetical protein